MLGCITVMQGTFLLEIRLFTLDKVYYVRNIVIGMAPYRPSSLLNLYEILVKRERYIEKKKKYIKR